MNERAVKQKRASQARIAELEAEVERLREEVNRLDGEKNSAEYNERDNRNAKWALQARIDKALTRMSPLISAISGDMKDSQLVEVSAGFIRLLVSALEGEDQ